MTTKATQVKHVFAGGWATDFGPTAQTGIDKNNQVPIPYLVDAENLSFELDGGIRKVGGADKLNSTVVESGEQIRGLYDYWKQGTGGSPTQKRIIHAGTKILKDDADGTFDALFTGLEDDTVPSYATFDDILLIASDSNTDVPKSWDGSTAQDLAGSPPNLGIIAIHKNRAWGAGVAANPSRLYYAVDVDPEDWAGSGSGSIDIDPNDGDRITAIASHKNELWVFKGPYKGSIHRITGSAPTGGDAFARTTFIDGLGAVAHNTIFRFRDDLGFIWSDGSIHSLAATAAFGDFEEASLSRPINRYIRDHVNADRLTHAWAATDVLRGVVVFTIPVDTSTDNNLMLMMDYRFNPVRWAKWSAFAGGALASIVDQTNNNQPSLMFGGNDGFVRRMNRPTRAIDSTTAISTTVTTPFLSYGNQIMMKTISEASVGISPKGAYNATFGWQRDDNAQQTQTFSQGGGDVLGVASANQFTLGTSTLGGSSFVDRFMDLPEGGEFRSAQYQVKNSGVNEDLEVHSISTAIKGQAWSTES